MIECCLPNNNKKERKMTGQYIILTFSILLAIYATFYVAREHKKEKKYKKNKS